MLAAAPVITGFALAAGSDSGVAAAPATLTDDITNVVMPTLTGNVSEAATVNVYVDTNGDGVLEVGTDQLLGTTTVTAAAGGNWSIPSTVSLNEAAVSSTIDGPRTLFAQAVAGQNTSVVATLDIVLDTVGPQVASVTANGQDVFLRTPTGPTAATTALDITFTDSTAEANATALPTFAAINSVLAQETSNYSLTGANQGNIPISSVTYTNDPNGATGTTEVQLNFASALPDDTYTLDISDKLESDAGNALDGLVTTTDTGTDTIVLPSGNGTPGSGSFSAQFVVQTAPAVTGLALASGSDSGVAADAATLTDNVTNVVLPTLTGTAPETSTINIYSGSTSGQLLGTTTVPGTNPATTATWSVTLATSLNDPSVSSTTDGARTLVAQAVNTSGIAGTADTLNVFVDTAAPTVSSVTFASNGQSVTSATSGPTPSTTGLDIAFTDATASANASVVGTFNPDFAAVDSSIFSRLQQLFQLGRGQWRGD